MIVSVFTGTEQDGHGQHQAAGYVAHQVFDLAGDPNRFPELLTEEGLQVWEPRKLYRGSWFRRDSTSVVLNAGGIDPRDGRTFHQIAMASRSQHSSQDMGQLQEIGPRESAVTPVRDRTGAGMAMLFAGLPREANWVTAAVDSLRDAVSAPRLADALPALNEILRRMRAEGTEARRDSLVSRAVLVAGHVVVDATADQEHLVPGTEITVRVHVYNAGRHEARVRRLGVRVPHGWDRVGDDEPVRLASGEELERTFTVQVPATASPTQPYFLRRARHGDMYDWSDTEPAVRGMLFDAPAFVADVEMTIDEGPAVHALREVTFRYNDQAVGEIRRPLMVVPRVGVRLEPTLLVWSSTGPRETDMTVELTHFTADSTRGSVALDVDGWAVSAAQPFAFGRNGETRTAVFRVERPEDAVGGTVAVRARVTADDGSPFDSDVRTIDYPHVRPTQWLREAQGTIRLAPIELPAVASVGYIRGASDRVPEALKAAGLPVEILTEDVLATGDLAAYDVIVVGPRAYETDEALRRHNDRLLAYAHAGGHVVVQYQQRQFAEGEYAPFLLGIPRPTARITDEYAPVRVLEPNHPIFRNPNAIGSADWDGWIQERGLYFGDPWGDEFTPLLEMTDPEGNDLRGSLLVSRYGAGTYVYAALSFFRTIPAGVTGTYRLFMNLLAWTGDE